MDDPDRRHDLVPDPAERWRSSHLLADGAHQLGVAAVIIPGSHVVLERREELMVDLDVVLAVLSDRVLLRQPDAAVLHGREHGRGHVGVVGENGGVVDQAARQQSARLDGYRSQLRLAAHHVADGVDVGHCRLFGRRADHLAVSATDRGTVRGGRQPSATDRGTVRGGRQPSATDRGTVRGGRQPSATDRGTVRGGRQPSATDRGTVRGGRQPCSPSRLEWQDRQRARSQSEPCRRHTSWAARSSRPVGQH